MTKRITIYLSQEAEAVLDAHAPGSSQSGAINTLLIRYGQMMQATTSETRSVPVPQSAVAAVVRRLAVSGAAAKHDEAATVQGRGSGRAPSKTDSSQ